MQTASIEGAYAVATGKLKRFAEQELLECTYMLRNGCTGGLNSDAIEGVIKRQHHSTDTVMPYKAKGNKFGLRMIINNKNMSMFGVTHEM